MFRTRWKATSRMRGDGTEDFGVFAKSSLGTMTRNRDYWRAAASGNSDSVAVAYTTSSPARSPVLVTVTVAVMLSHGAAALGTDNDP